MVCLISCLLRIIALRHFAEVLKSSNTPQSQFIKKLIHEHGDYLSEVPQIPITSFLVVSLFLLQKLLSTRLTRGRDFTAFLTLLINFYKRLSDITMLTPTALKSQLEEPAVTSTEETHIRAALDRFVRITSLRDPTSGAENHGVFTRPKRLAPVEFWWLVWVVRHVGDVLGASDGQVLEVMEEMRTKVAQHHAGEVKNNSKGSSVSLQTVHHKLTCQSIATSDQDDPISAQEVQQPPLS